MHEMSIAMNIIELASEAAQKAEARCISSIELEVGTLAGVMIESLEFCFEAAARHTLAEGADLKIVSIPAKGRCFDCEKIATLTSLTSQCPDCGASLLHITGGQELKIKAITVDEA